MMTVNEMIDSLNKMKEDGYGDCKMMHSYNTIQEVTKTELDGETFIWLKGTEGV
jgi:hypothetical protein